MFLDYQTACRYAQMLNSRGVHPRVGVRHITVQRGSIVQTFYRVVSLP